MLHSPERFVLVPVESEPVLWEYAPAYGLLGWTGELGVAPGWHAFGSGSLAHEHAGAFAGEIVSVLDERGIRDERVGVDRVDTVGHAALLGTGIRVADAQLPLKVAGSIKCKSEVDALRESARVCDAALDRLNMVLSIEAYVGPEDGLEGVKLEEQILIAAEGFGLFSQAPYDERLVP
jgi:Xaa-Pro dipeptidase